TIINDGKVGINSSTPSHTLEINGDMLVGSNSYFLGNIGIGTGNPNYELDVTGDINFTGDLLYNGNVFNPNYWQQNGNNIYYDNGNVGIGTDNPLSKLHVIGDVFLLGPNSENQLQILGNEQIPERRGISISDDPNGAFNFYIHSWQSNAAFNFIDAQNNNNLMTINENGNVGIGIYPSAKFEVDGKIKTTELQITDGSTNTNGQILISDQYGIASWTDPSELNDGDWYINESNGNIYTVDNYVGIDNQNPITELDVCGDIVLGMPGENFIIHSRKWIGDQLIIAPQNNNSGWDWSKSITLFDNGKVGIGFSDLQYAIAKLTVDGDILAEEIKVRINAGGGSDFVFDDNYKLPDLDDIENYVKTHKHLPDIPSAEEMQENGLELGDMQIKLLQKIEELTLYVIELKKENMEMKKEIKELKED
ncbi:MAG: hypothetical protein K8R58_10975, partial [Bacteroidales bacterium]|nr:hypothetical protein [Bacteroidales bacterium]